MIAPIIRTVCGGLALCWLAAACSVDEGRPISEIPNNQEPGSPTPDFYYGADLSYVNEMEDCGAVYKDAAGSAKDPYVIFKDAGANLVRLRLWHNPTWTQYSDYEDVKKAIRRAKNAGLRVLLDFHYSDTWADPERQEIPAAWAPHLDNTTVLGDSLYRYTYAVLSDLANSNLLPEIVQVGNEINLMILQKPGAEPVMNWQRNAALINRGIRAVRDVSKEKGQQVEVMLHIAQPENGVWWFAQATQNGITDFDWIGLSYYPLWSKHQFNDVGSVFRSLVNTYRKKLMVVETAYPFTMQNADPANNILNQNALIPGYPATQQGQLDYLNKLQEIIQGAGGAGLIYWEPAWVSTSCRTLWGQGSHWDNATLFDQNYRANLGMGFYKGGKTR